MKPVNLLPPEHRPRGSAGRRSGSAGGGPKSSYALLAALALILVAAVAYVYSHNAVTTARDDTARLAAETKRLEAQAGALGSFADFAQVKQSRTNAVRTIAARRFDWERLVREVSLVLPDGTWLIDFDANSGRSTSAAPGAAAPPGGSNAQAPPASPTAGASGAGAAAGGPSLRLVGCARVHRQVATALVRLRRLHRGEDVTLVRSVREESTGPNAGGGGMGAGSTGAPENRDCGSLRGRKNLTWEANVKLSATAPGAPDLSKVPVSLGGGS